MSSHRGRRAFAVGALAGLALAGTGPRAAAQGRLQVVTETLPPPPLAERGAGRLVYRGGVALSARDSRFGGWSDLWLSPDGAQLVMISDFGWFLEARLALDAEGVPLVVEAARLGALPIADDPAMRRHRPDAEGLARAADGGFLVSFEGSHRIWHYPGGGPVFSRPPVPVRAPAGLAKAPANGGMEALAAWPDGTLAVLAEEMVDAAGDHLGWIGGSGAWTPFTLAASAFSPTGACVSPDGDLIVLGRRFAFFTFAARISRLTRRQCAGGGRVQDLELGQWHRPDWTDNFEGVAARRGRRGETLLYLLSDDNYRRTLQRTLLLCFELRD
jgi:hypothetical protein